MVDDIPHEVRLVGGEYEGHHQRFESDLPQMITKVLEENNIPVVCKVAGIRDDSPRTVLLFEHKDSKNSHKIDLIGGTSFNQTVGSIYDTVEHVDGTYYIDLDFPSEILVVYPDLSQISAEIVARQNKESDIDGDLVIRQKGDTDLEGSLSISAASLLNAVVSIRRKESNDLDSQIGVPTDGNYDLGSFLSVNAV